MSVSGKTRFVQIREDADKTTEPVNNGLLER